jgi:hypothetical protein
MNSSNDSSAAAAMPAKYGKPSLGCYCDGANGQDHNDRKLLRLALGYGWTGPDAEEATKLLATEEEDDDRSDEALDRVEALQGLTQTAEEWLNEQETRPFTYWGWNDGNFGLWANVDGAREDCGFVSRKRIDEETNPEDASYPADDYRGEWLHVSDHGNATLYIREDDASKPEGFRDVEVWGVV